VHVRFGRVKPYVRVMEPPTADTDMQPCPAPPPPARRQSARGGWLFAFTVLAAAAALGLLLARGFPG